MGTHTVTVTYEGNEFYESATATTSFEVFGAEEDEDDWVLDYNEGMISFRELVTLSDRFESGSLVITDSRGNVLFRRNVTDMEVNHDMKGYKYDQFRGYVVFKEDLENAETGVYNLTITYYNDENVTVESVNPTVYLDYTSYVTGGEIDINDNNSPLFGFYVFDGMDNGHFEIEIFNGEDTDEDPIKIITKDALTQYIHGTIEYTNDVLELDEGIYSVRVNYVPNDIDPSDHSYYWKYNYFHHEIITIVDNSKFRVRMVAESFLDENSQFLVYCPKDHVGDTITIKVTSGNTTYSFDFVTIVNDYELFGFGDLNIYAPGLYQFNIYDENGTSLIETYEYEIVNPLVIPDVCVVGAEGLEKTPVVILYTDKIDNARLVLVVQDGDVLFNETLTDDYYHSLGYDKGYYILYSDCNPALTGGTYNLIASYYIIDLYGEHLRLTSTGEIRIVERNYVEDNDTGVGIELFDYEEHNLDDDEDLIAWVSVPDYEEGYVTVVLDNDDTKVFTFDEIDDDDGLPTFFISLFDKDVDEGDHFVTVTYFDGDNNPVLSLSALMSFFYSGGDEDEPIGTSLSADDLFMTYKDGSAWTVTLTDENDNPIANAIVKIDILGKVYDRKTNADGVASLPINLAIGIYDIEATFEGDLNYLSSSVSASVYVNYPPATLSAEDIIMVEHDGTEYTLFVTDSNGNPVVDVPIMLEMGDEMVYIQTNEEGRASRPIDLYVGVYDFTATFEGSDTASPASIVSKVTVCAPNESVLSADDLEMCYKDGSAWTVTLTDASGNPMSNAIVKIGIVGKVYNRKTDANGVASLPINLGVGVYDINATFDGDANHQSAFARATVTVKNPAAILSAEDVVMVHSDGSEYAVTLTDPNGNPIVNTIVKINIVGITYDRKTDENGVATLPINLAVGVYDITATFEGNARYSSASIANTVFVNTPDTTTISAEDLVMCYKDGSAWTVTLTDASGNPIVGSVVKIGIVGKYYTTVTDANGVASLAINLRAGVYDVNATFEGDEIHEAAFTSASITVKQPAAVLTADDVVMNYRDGTSYDVTLTDPSGSPIANSIVKITVVGKTYSIRTNENGVASLPINLAVGTYDISAKFEGNGQYSDVEIANTIVVNRV